MNPISKTGVWIDDNEADFEARYQFDYRLAGELAVFFDFGSVVDLGCGIGLYADYLEGGGYDGNPRMEEFTSGRYKSWDLTEPRVLDEKWDWVLCLEVAEHIPAEYEDVFIKNLHNNNLKGIVLSWAVEGQGGDGHVNERNNYYVIEKITALGYTWDEVASQKLRDNSTLPWFKNTIMVFRR